MAVRAEPLPPGALLARYRETPGAYTDCFTTTLSAHASQAEYVEAFYTTPWFKAERLVLAAAVRKPSTDEGARRLARGEVGAFAAWTVEARADDQLLVCDFLGSTRSWLMSAPDGQGTKLWFGTALVTRKGRTSLDPQWRALIPFHRVYARALLAAAAHRLSLRNSP